MRRSAPRIDLAAKVPPPWVGLMLLCLFAVCELAASARAYRSTISDEDWQAVATQLEAMADATGTRTRTRAEPARLVVAPEWLLPRARHHLDTWLMPPEGRKIQSSIGAPDFRGIHDLWVLTSAGANPWPPRFDVELGRRTRPRLQAEFEIGGLELHHYRFARPPPGRDHHAWQLRDLVEHAELTITTSSGKCRLRNAAASPRWNCAEGQISQQFAEFDHQPRRCLSLALREGTTVRMSWRAPAGPLPAQVFGHVGFPNFNARLRNAAPLELAFGSESAGQLSRRTLTNRDAHGRSWQRFEFAAKSPVAQERHWLELTVGVTGTWQRGRYHEKPEKLPCMEWRTSAPRPPGQSDEKPMPTPEGTRP